MTNDALNQIAAAYGSIPTATGAQTVDIPSYAFEAFEDTTFGAFYDSAGNELIFHPWKGKTVLDTKIAWLGQNVASFTITAGGAGQYFPVSSEMPAPALLSAATNVDGDVVILTFDRVMADPSDYAADFTVTADDVEITVSAADLGTDTKTIELTLSTAVLVDEVVLVSMDYGHVTTSRGAKAEAITEQEVTNNAV